MSIITLCSMPIYGDAYNDGPRLAMAHAIVCDESASMDDRIEALRQMDETMGITSDDYHVDGVRQYVFDCVADDIY